MSVENSKPSTLTSWPVVRSAPNGRCYGRSFSLFINNANAFLEPVDVYADGLFSAWDSFDRDLFEKSFQSHWIVTRPEPGQLIYMYSFGATYAKDEKWFFTEDDIRETAWRALRELNPTSVSLLDMEGDNTMQVGDCRHSKLGRPNTRPYRTVGGVDRLGGFVPVLVRNHGVTELTRLFVFDDGMCRLGADGPVVSDEEALSWLERGILSNGVAAGARVSIDTLGEFTSECDFGEAEDGERQKEIRDLQKILKGERGALQECGEAYGRFEDDPSPENMAVLRTTYAMVPKHLRWYLSNGGDEVGIVLGLTDQPFRPFPLRRAGSE